MCWSTRTISASSGRIFDQQSASFFLQEHYKTSFLVFSLFLEQVEVLIVMGKRFMSVGQTR